MYSKLFISCVLYQNAELSSEDSSLEKNILRK